MLVKKSPLPISDSRGFQEELANLYARRTKIDTLIRTLQEYDRLQMQASDRTRKTA